MRLFFHLLFASIREQLTYRLAILAGLVTNIAFGVLRAALIVALFTYHDEVNGLTLKDGLTFVIFGQAMISTLILFGDTRLIQSVIEGNIGVLLLRPISLPLYWIAQEMGYSIVNFAFRALPMALAFYWLYPFKIPASITHWGSVLTSLSLAWLVNFFFRFLVNLTGFFTPDARGIARGAFALSQLFCGFLLPLKMYPDWFQNLVAWTPFPSSFNTPMEIFLGKLHGADFWFALTQQILWIAVLGALSWSVMRWGIRHLTIQGG